jgi:hypothetical protein
MKQKQNNRNILNIWLMKQKQNNRNILNVWLMKQKHRGHILKALRKPWKKKPTVAFNQA